MNNLIMTPDDPEFDYYLHSAPPPGSNWVEEQKTFVVDAITGLLRQVNRSQLDDYLYGGEYDEVMEDQEE